ncbi:MAG: hypothetical protein ACK6D3_11340, partial [Planctomycetaceae bacterium]
MDGRTARMVVGVRRLFPGLLGLVAGAGLLWGMASARGDDNEAGPAKPPTVEREESHSPRESDRDDAGE